tara:strand:+ start:620 stop:862 length:243 start_codon:yes stop_codon:yes gene_type:complete
MLHDADVVLDLGSILLDVVTTRGGRGSESNHATHGRAHAGHLVLERGTVCRLFCGGSVIAGVVVRLGTLVITAIKLHHGR